MQQSLLLPIEPALKPHTYTKIVCSIVALMPAIFIGRVGWVGMKVQS